MGTGPAGIHTTHNEPSTLTEVEKAVRARRRFVKKEIKLLKQRIQNFSRIADRAVNPVRKATAQAEVAVARMSLEKFEAEWLALEKAAVN